MCCCRGDLVLTKIGNLFNLYFGNAAEMYPTEATRAELSVRLGLTDRQLQMWFCHRRLKDKKEATGMAAMKPRNPSSAGGRGLTQSPREDLMPIEPGSKHESGSGPGSESDSGSESGSSRFDNSDEVPMAPRYSVSPKTIMERRVIACVEAQLGEPLREDGPILGMDFDELPPGAFGAPIGMPTHYLYLFYPLMFSCLSTIKLSKLACVFTKKSN